MHASSAKSTRLATLTSSVMPGELQLIVVTGDTQGRVIPLRDEVMVLGRAPDVSVPIDDEDVSRRHARLSYDRARKVWQLADLKSRNGTWLNGRRVDHGTLQPGDKLRLGGRVTFEVANDAVERELRQRQRLELVGRATLGIVHDFNNMLAVGIANVEYLSELPAGERSESALRECMDETRIALQRASELGSRLLRTASADEGPRGRVDVAGLCDEVRGLVQRIMPRSISIDVSTVAGLFVAGLSCQLQQVLVNLCLNARDAMPDGGTLSMSIERQRCSTTGSTMIAVRVTDTGCGMDEATVRRIFEPFFTTKREGRGFGLGLAMASEIVASHGGRIDVDSALGRGTTFTVRLPELDQRRRVSTTTDAPVHVVAGAGVHVLLVDDQPDLRRALRRVLERAGFMVTDAADGASALAAIAATPFPPDVAIVDFDMPGMNGLQTCRALRERIADLPTLLASGGRVDMAQVPEMQPFVSRSLTKPIGREALLETIDGLLGGPAAASRSAHDSSPRTRPMVPWPLA